MSRHRLWFLEKSLTRGIYICYACFIAAKCGDVFSKDPSLEEQLEHDSNLLFQLKGRTPEDVAHDMTKPLHLPFCYSLDGVLEIVQLHKKHSVKKKAERVTKQQLQGNTQKQTPHWRNGLRSPKKPKTRSSTIPPKTPVVQHAWTFSEIIVHILAEASAHFEAGDNILPANETKG